MRILAIEHERNVNTLPVPPSVLRDEARAVWDLQKRGVIREMWSTASDRRAILLLECAGAAEAREVLCEMPLVRHAAAEFSVLELRSYDGLERLFAPEEGAPRRVPAEPAEY